MAIGATALSGCQGGGEDGGIIGTGIQLRGTVSSERTLARTSLDIRDAEGQVRTASIGPDGQFATTLDVGAGPWLLRVDLGNDDAYYAIAWPGDETSVRNVHAYSDLALRSWYATRGLSIDDAFGASTTVPLPSRDELDAIEARLAELIAPSLNAWDLAGIDLATTEFVSNGTGVDRFLGAHPVRIADARSTIVLSDPDLATQARAVNALPLATDLAAGDTTPPEPPGVLRALPSALDEIVLAWSDATDDIGVASYEILRDGSVIANSPYPVFIDAPLQAERDYRYTVVSIDAAGNRSAPSIPASASPLAAPDVTPPPAPVELRLDATRDSVTLRWGQSDIGDVAAFEIERGRRLGTLGALARVTSTFAIDAGLNSATEYCYRVRASDAAGNLSTPTDTACITTPGDDVRTVVAGVDDGPAGVLASLARTDVSGLACTTAPDTLRVTTAMTLQGDCLTVGATLSVADGGELTIAPGTVLKFARGGGLRVEAGGALIAAGTASAPIVLSGTIAAPGSWNGVEFRFSDEARNRLSHTVIEYAGAGGSAQLRSDARQTLPVRLQADALLLRRGAGRGFDFARDTTLVAFTRIGSSENASSGRLGATAAATLGTDSTFGGNADDGVRVWDDSTTEPLAWNRIDVPWLVNRLSLGTSLAIAPGARLLFDTGGQLTVEQTGSFRAVGTAALPIILAARDATPGAWMGIQYLNSGSDANRLEHVALSHGGASDSAGNPGGNLRLECRAFAPARLRIIDSVIADSAGHGILRDIADECDLDIAAGVVFERIALDDLGSRAN